MDYGLEGSIKEAVSTFVKTNNDYLVSTPLLFD